MKKECLVLNCPSWPFYVGQPEEILWQKSLATVSSN